jgi:hypothetical protein
MNFSTGEEGMRSFEAETKRKKILAGQLNQGGQI